MWTFSWWILWLRIPTKVSKTNKILRELSKIEFYCTKLYKDIKNGKTLENVYIFAIFGPFWHIYGMGIIKSEVQMKNISSNAYA